MQCVICEVGTEFINIVLHEQVIRLLRASRGVQSIGGYIDQSARLERNGDDQEKEPGFT
jgi:hypothetical protein